MATLTKPAAEYDTTLALIAGNIAAHLAGQSADWLSEEGRRQRIITTAVAMARDIVATVTATTIQPLAHTGSA